MPTPLLNPKITTEVYLSKVKMLTPSVKNVQNESKNNHSSSKKVISVGTKNVSPKEETKRKNIINRLGKPIEGLDITITKKRDVQ